MAEKAIYVPNPQKATLSKSLAGISDLYIQDGVYKFMGCTVVSLNMSLGFNSTSSSVSLTLVEDLAAGDSFIAPSTPSLWAVSLPKGGVGVPIFYQNGKSLNPDSFFPKNTPFYFCGICTSYNKSIKDVGGNLITVNLVDPREVLTGVLCLLNSFSLTTQIGSGGNLDNNLNIKNIIDVFGYFGYGMQSGRNDYGISWNIIIQCLLDTRVTLHDISYEFTFNGDPFLKVPNWYRIDEQNIDLIGLCQRVAKDGGADFIAIARKASANETVVELRSIDRTNGDELTKSTLNNFVKTHKEIISSVKIGKEQRNEPTSSIVIGGMQNSQYIAYPAKYDQTMHLDGNNYENYNAFPPDIKTRLFGGFYSVPSDFSQNAKINFTNKVFKVNSGAIYPCWGFTPDDHAYPLIEPVLFLDHLVFDKISNDTGKLKECIPSLKISVKSFMVRQVTHADLFLQGDGSPDLRPFAYLEKYTVGSATPEGYIKGLPLNTEVLRASLVSEYAFYDLYSLYYPDIAQAFGCPRPDWKSLQDYISAVFARTGKCPDISKIGIYSFLKQDNDIITLRSTTNMGRNANGQIAKNIPIWDAFSKASKRATILFKFRTIIYDMVRQYALEWMGKKFLVCLPKSFIMNRIWFNLPVPTHPEKPQIEYVVDQKGYFTQPIVDSDFTKIANVNANKPLTYAVNFSDLSVEQQVRRRFMADDGRFSPMVLVDWKPTGNINFNSNGFNKAMFQDLPPSDFRPNRIATGNPDKVFVGCQVNQLVKRPDLALVEFPGPISFDPQELQSIFMPFVQGAELLNNEFIATKAGVMKYFWYFICKDQDLRNLISQCATSLGINPSVYANQVFSNWAVELSYYKSQWFLRQYSTEIIMDFRKIVIPLTSTFVAYGPWIADYHQAKGMINLDVDQSLVPWNFTYQFDVNPLNPNPPKPDGLTPDQRLDNAGKEKLARSLSNVDYLDNASITVTGFPEYGPAQGIGYNSNLTGISVEFGVGGIKTTYNLSTYAARPGTYRKSDYDNVSRSRFDTRERIPDPKNDNIINTIIINPINKFQT